MQIPGHKLPAIALALLVFCLNPSWSQTNVGQISGKVFDSTGAVVPKCTITATNLETGLRQSATTDDGGTYSFPSLPRGTYTVRAEAAGLPVQRAVRRDSGRGHTARCGLHAGARRADRDDLGGRSLPTRCRPASGDVSQLITERQLTQIALNGRNYVQMLQLVPGVVSTSTDPFSLGLTATAQRVNGVRTNSIYFMVDGTDNMDNGANSNAIINPNIDAIAEIKILTSSYSAEFGGRAGAIMNVVMKGGTRDFHGSLFEFVRNDSFDARSFFSLTTPPLRFNNFGWTLGGPLYIPGKWNTGQRQVVLLRRPGMEVQPSGRRADQHRAHTAAERTGDFRSSSLAAPIDPLNGQAFPNRTVPAARFSKNGPPLLKPYPLPNFGGPGGNYSVNGVNRTDTREDLLKVDYLLSPSTQISYRWTHDECGHLERLSGRQHRDRSRRAAASRLDHHCQSAPDPLAHHAELLQLQRDGQRDSGRSAARHSEALRPRAHVPGDLRQQPVPGRART